MLMLQDDAAHVEAEISKLQETKPVELITIVLRLNCRLLQQMNSYGNLSICRRIQQEAGQ